MPPHDKYPKIFQIGFNKSGTTSIHNFFLENDIPSVHQDAGRLSRSICRNFRNGLPLLTGYEEYQAFCDMEHHLKKGGMFYTAERYFKELDRQYPGSLFILNYRDLEDWLESRERHSQYLIYSMMANGDSAEAVFERWRREYYDHIWAVRDYFGDRPTLLELDVSRDDPEKLGRFLEGHGFRLETRALPKKRPDRPPTEAEKAEGRNRAIGLAKQHEIRDDIETALGALECAALFWPEDKRINRRLSMYRKMLRKRNARSGANDPGSGAQA